jgi:hypothetical protein
MVKSAQWGNDITHHSSLDDWGFEEFFGLVRWDDAS